jgi:hypothetical protein
MAWTYSLSVNAVAPGSMLPLAWLDNPCAQDVDAIDYREVVLEDTTSPPTKISRISRLASGGLKGSASCIEIIAVVE